MNTDIEKIETPTVSIYITPEELERINRTHEETAAIEGHPNFIVARATGKINSGDYEALRTATIEATRREKFRQFIPPSVGIEDAPQNPYSDSRESWAEGWNACRDSIWSSLKSHKEER